jgi:hypothetical protein
VCGERRTREGDPSAITVLSKTAALRLRMTKRNGAALLNDSGAMCNPPVSHIIVDGAETIRHPSGVRVWMGDGFPVAARPSGLTTG